MLEMTILEKGFFLHTNPSALSFSAMFLNDSPRLRYMSTILL
jgi:hypothetical protein